MIDTPSNGATKHPPAGPSGAPGPTAPQAHTSLSAADRAAAFASGTAPVDRAAALRAGSTPVPRKVILWIIVGFAALGLGGVVVEHFFGNAGAGSATATPTTLAGTGGTGGAAPPTPTPPAAPPVNASIDSFLGLKQLGTARAPAVALHDQNGAPWALGSAHGKVVVLTFFDSACDDICPVLAEEISQADALLGPGSANVEFVVVNTDPLATSATPPPPALTESVLSGQANVTFLNGQLAGLNGIWSSYGVSVTVQKSTHVVTHNDIMYFIDPLGRLRLRATPFANEDQLGSYSLPPGDIQRFAQGVAASAASLARRPS